MSRGSNWFCSSSQRERKNAPNRGGIALGLSYTHTHTYTHTHRNTHTHTHTHTD